MKKLFLALVFTLTLVGCQGESETKTGYCTGSETTQFGYTMDHDYQFEYADDKVLKQTITITTTFIDEAYLEEGVLSEDTKKLLDEQAGLLKDEVEGSEGMVYEFKYEGAKLIETYSIDYSKVTNEELVKVGLLDSADSEASFISMEKTVTNLEDSGFTCTVE